ASLSEGRGGPVAALLGVSFPTLDGRPFGSVTVPDRGAVFTCAEVIAAQPSSSKHAIITIVSARNTAKVSRHRIELDTPTPCFHCMSPPVWHQLILRYP